MISLTLMSSFALLCVLTVALRRYTRTTLIAPIWWSIVSVTSIVACESFIAWSALEWASVLRYTAATSTLCPAIAVLGAKRPQDSGWKFIVASLWLVLILPAIQTMLFGSVDLNLHWAWRYFLLLVLLAGWSNYALTRFWFASCLVLTAQIMMFGRHLPAFGFEPTDHSMGIGISIATVAGCLVWWQARMPSTNGIGRVWNDFKNAFGTVWGLRIMERINASAEQQEWSQTLMWSGLVASTTADQPSPNEADEIEQSFRTHLRRFVDTDWIDRRLK